jgi:hypothetical protein
VNVVCRMQVGDESARVRCGLRYHQVGLPQKLPWSKLTGWRASRPKVEGEIDFPCSGHQEASDVWSLGKDSCDWPRHSKELRAPLTHDTSRDWKAMPKVP